MPSAGNGVAPLAEHQTATTEDNDNLDSAFPATALQRLIYALLTSGTSDMLDAATAKALRLTCKAVRDLTDILKPLTNVSLRLWSDNMDAMLNSSLASTAVNIELLSSWHEEEAVPDALNLLMDHNHLARRIQRLSFDAKALGEATGPLVGRVMALPSLTSLGLSNSKPEELVKHIEAGNFAGFTSLHLELERHGEKTETSAPQLWVALASLPRLARLKLSGPTHLCFPLKIDDELRFGALKDLQLAVENVFLIEVQPCTKPRRWLERAAWPALRRFSAGPLTQGIANSISNAPWLSQITEIDMKLGDGRDSLVQGAPLMAALSGSTNLRRLSLSKFGGEANILTGCDFPCLKVLRLELSWRRELASGVLIDLYGASIPRLQDLYIRTSSSTKHLRAPPSSLPLPWLRRLEIDLSGLSATSVAPDVPAYHAVPLLLMNSVVEATIHTWENMLVILNALWDMGDSSRNGHFQPPPPAWPRLRVLRLTGSCHASHVIEALRDKARHCPALQEVWIEASAGNDWGAFLELKTRATGVAASNCWPELRFMTIHCGDKTDGEYQAVWWATQPAAPPFSSRRKSN